ARAPGGRLRAASPAPGAAHRPDLAAHYRIARPQGRGCDDRGAPPVHDDARGGEAELHHAHLVGAWRVPRPPRDTRGIPVSRSTTVRKSGSDSDYPDPDYHLFRSSRSLRNTVRGSGVSGRSGNASRSFAITLGLVRRKKVLISRSTASVDT